MDDLIAFLAARLDEDEAAAKAWLPLGNPTAAQREHIGRHDPARVLRDVDAKRVILAQLNAYQEDPEGWAAIAAGAVEDVIEALAAVYSDHPDYRPERKP